MSDNGTPGASVPLQFQVVIRSDGFGLDTRANCPLDVAEGLVARALANIGREILVVKLAQAEALREAAKPRISLAGGPMI